MAHPIPRTTEEVFSDFRGRRAVLIKALTNKERLKMAGPSEKEETVEKAAGTTKKKKEDVKKETFLGLSVKKDENFYEWNSKKETTDEEGSMKSLIIKLRLVDGF